MKTLFILLYLFVLAIFSASAEDYYPADSSVIGKVEQYTIKKGESLIELARKFNLGYNEIADANPGVDPFVPPAGITVQIPMKWIVPDVPKRNGIVINISEMRLYFFTGKGTNMMTTFPVGVGDEGKETPVGEFKVIKKIVEPSWHVPKSIKLESPELPSVVPPGPENPLGSHALRLSIPSVLIHGTNKPWSLGRMATHGCIRLYPEDISKLFLMVRKGEKVTIVRQPIKVGVLHNRIFMEVHNDENSLYLLDAVNALGNKKLLDRVDGKKMLRAYTEKSGIPVDITMDQPLTSDELVKIKLFPPDWKTDITK
jgi:L,D-transpeptidase ErfK/SrfK